MLDTLQNNVVKQYTSKQVTRTFCNGSVFSLLRTLGLHELLIEFGQGKILRWIHIYDICIYIGPQRCRGILFFFFTLLLDKKTAWQTWDVCPQVTDVFAK